MQHVVAVLPITIGLDTVIAAEKLRLVLVANDLVNFFARPNVELALHPFTVGILRRIKSTFGTSHVAQYVIASATRDVGIKRITRDLIRIDVTRNELRLIVEHLLEMRHEPSLIDTVPMKTAAKLIEQSAFAHHPEGVQRHLARRDF